MVNLITHHALVLLFIAAHPSATQRVIARNVGLSEAYTGMIIRELLAQEFLFAERHGVRYSYKVNHDAVFRHPLLSGCSLDRFAELFGVSTVDGAGLQA